MGQAAEGGGIEGIGIPEGHLTLEFEKKITLGNILTTVVLLVGIVGGYARLSQSHEMMAEKITTLESNAEHLRAQFVRSDIHDYQVRVINEKLEEIKQDVKEIKRFVK